MTLPTVTHLRRTFALAAAAAVIGLVACDDPFAPKADAPTLEAAIEVWALTGSPPNYPTVILVPQRLTVRPDAAASFDLGFDIGLDGRLLVLPVSKVVTSTIGDRRVGILVSDDIFGTITEAPRTGYVFDSIMTVDVGQAFIVRVQTQFCANQFQTEIYAKYVVDSIIPAERRIRLVGRVNPNCGFRSFLPGIPTF